MVIMFQFDGDSGIKTLEGEWMVETIWESTYLVILSSKEHKNLFIENWYKRNLGISDKVYSTLEPIFEDVVYCLMNNKAETFQNGNYTIKLLEQIDLYWITNK